LFKYTESKNCKNQIKGIYELDTVVSMDLVEKMKSFGELKILDFSQFSPKAKVFFKITHQDIYSIEGTLNEKLIFFSCKKDYMHIKNKWEAFLSEFYNKSA
jgi:hypothetical protein